MSDRADLDDIRLHRPICLAILCATAAPEVYARLSSMTEIEQWPIVPQVIRAGIALAERFLAGSLDFWQADAAISSLWNEVLAWTPRRSALDDLFETFEDFEFALDPNLVSREAVAQAVAVARATLGES